jgi:hypothetical protein
LGLILIDTSIWARLKAPTLREMVSEAILATAVVMTPPILLELLPPAAGDLTRTPPLGQLDPLNSRFPAC